MQATLEQGTRIGDRDARRTSETNTYVRVCLMKMTTTIEGPTRAGQTQLLAVVTSDGKEWSWPSLFEEFAPAIRSFACSRGCSSPDDIVQEVLSTAVERFSKFEGDTTGLRSLLFTVAYRRIADEHRSHHRSKEYLVADPPPIPDENPSIEDLVTRRESQAEAKAALRILTGRERRVIEMRIVQEASPAEVARALGISNGNVRVIQARALTKVRKYLTAGQPRPLASIGLLATFLKSLRGDMRGVDDLRVWIEKLRAADAVSPGGAMVSSAVASTGWLAAGTLKVGLLVSLTTATTLGSVAVANSSDHPAPLPEPAISSELPVSGPVTPSRNRSDGLVEGTVKVARPAPGPIAREPEAPASAGPGVPKADPSSSAEPGSTEADIGPVVETRVTVVEETVDSVVEEVLEPVIDDVLVPVVAETTEVLVDDVVEPLVDQTVEPLIDDVVVPVVEEETTEAVVEPVVEEIVEPAVEDVTDLTDQAVEDVTDLVGPNLGGLLDG